MKNWESMKKIISYIGFAIKSNNCISGQTPLKRTTKQLNLILVCSSASENLKNLAKNLAVKHGCEYIVTKPSLESLTNLKDIKIIGLTDENLSKAIINNKENINIG